MEEINGLDFSQSNDLMAIMGAARIHGRPESIENNGVELPVQVLSNRTSQGGVINVICQLGVSIRIVEILCSDNETNEPKAVTVFTYNNTTGEAELFLHTGEVDGNNRITYSEEGHRVSINQGAAEVIIADQRTSIAPTLS